jgi:hypothetical protein
MGVAVGTGGWVVAVGCGVAAGLQAASSKLKDKKMVRDEFSPDFFMDPPESDSHCILILAGIQLLRSIRARKIGFRNERNATIKDAGCNIKKNERIISSFLGNKNN